MERKKIGVFGSAFNPPTKGHADAINQATKVFDEVWLFPSFAHAHGKKPIPFEIRIELVTDLISFLEDKNVKVSDLEKECHETLGKEYVYTYDLLSYLSKKYPECDFKFICGKDNSSPDKWVTFYKSQEIDKIFGKFIVEERVDARSTYIREAINKEEWSKVEELTFEPIVKKLKELKYY